jgi:hypothetical protein
MFFLEKKNRKTFAAFCSAFITLTINQLTSAFVQKRSFAENRIRIGSKDVLGGAGTKALPVRACGARGSAPAAGGMLQTAHLCTDWH